METISTTPAKAASLAQKQRLFQEATRLIAAEQLFQQALNDPELALHCHIAGWQAGTLKILLDSAAWATRLRFQIPQLLETLKTQLPNLKMIEARVFPVQKASEIIYWQTKSISMATAEMIYDAACNLSDPKLKSALSRLAASCLQTSADAK